MEVDEVVRTGDEPVREVEEERTGDIPVRDVGGLIFTLKITLEMILRRWGSRHLRKPHKHQLPPAPEHPAETPSSAEPRRKRIKTLARRTDLPWIRKLAALKAKTSSSSQQTPQKQPSQPTRK